MAQRVQVILVDDLTGGEATESVEFALDGVTYEIDLSSENAAELRDAFSKWIGHARRSGGRRQTRRRSGVTATGRGADLAKVREWGRANGYQVSDRGRIPQEVQDAYAAAN